MKKTILLTLVLSIGSLLHAQERMNLRQCVDYAVKNSFAARQAQLSIASSGVDKKAADLARTPTATGSASHSYNFGRSVDPTTNSFATQTIQSNTFGVSGGVNIYNGGLLRNNIARADANMEAARLNAEQTANDLGLSVAQAYLTVLLAEESLAALEQQNTQTKAQLENTQKLITNGALAPNAVIDFESQLARNQQSIVNARNQVELSLLSLKQAMNMDLSTPLTIERPGDLEAPLASGAQSSEELYQTSMARMPSVKARGMQTLAAQLGVKSSQSALLPSLSAFYQVRTNFSSISKDYKQRATGAFNSTPITIDVPGVSVVNANIQTPVFALEGSTIPFFNQLDQNMSLAVGVQLNVPIWDGWQSRANIARSQIAVRNAELASEQTNVLLKADIVRAVASAKAAQQRYETSQAVVNALDAAFKNSQKRYQAGSANSFELTTAENSLVVSRFEVIQAKYDYLFRLKILDFYAGKTIE